MKRDLWADDPDRTTRREGYFLSDDEFKDELALLLGDAE
jgi:hypothetical protein